MRWLGRSQVSLPRALLWIAGIILFGSMVTWLLGRGALNLGYLALVHNQPVQAGLWFQRAIQIDPRSASAWRGQGEASLAQGKDREAVQALDVATTLCPDCLFPRLSRATARYAVGDQIGAIEDWKTVGSAEWLLQLGHEAWTNRRDVESALFFYQLATELAPHDWRTYYYWSAALRSGNPPQLEQAQVGLEKALELSPQNPEVLLLEGQIEYARERYDEATEHLSQYIRLRPHDFAGWYWRGLCWKAKGSLTEALLDLRQAVMLNATDPNPHLHLAETLEAVGDRAGAIMEFRAVLELIPGQPDSQRAIERLNRP